MFRRLKNANNLFVSYNNRKVTDNYFSFFGLQFQMGKNYFEIVLKDCLLPQRLSIKITEKVRVQSTWRHRCPCKNKQEILGQIDYFRKNGFHSQ